MFFKKYLPVFSVLFTILIALTVSFSMRGVAFAAPGLNITAKSAYLVSENGRELFAKNENIKRPIASMVKIMTLLLSFEYIEANNISFEDKISISQNAASMGGSQAFLDANGSYKIDELIKSIIIASANDSCYAMAEFTAGSVEAFVEKMNERAKHLGMENTLFANCTGLPGPEQYSTAKDVSIMSRELLKHKDYFRHSRDWMYDLVHDGGRVTGLTNTNKLVRFYEGCDFGKTGFTNEAMHCLSASAVRNGMRIISVIVGGTDSKTRFAECSSMLNYGFANFENKIFMKRGSEMKGVPVALGQKETARTQLQDDLAAFGQKGEFKGSVDIKEEYMSVKAPITVGQIVGRATAVKDGQVIAECNIVSSEEVCIRGYKDIIRDMFGKWSIRGGK